MRVRLVAEFEERVTTMRPPMKLLTHNMLMSPGTRNGYPLGVEAEKVDKTEAEFNGDFMARMVGKIDYKVLLSTLASLSVETTLPPQVPDNFAQDEPFLLGLHHALMEIEVIEGSLVCPETGKRFPIKEGIPSLL